ncbi:hypothetical protein CEXT_202011 [Caerostris extrusa]|uniref:Uncharacterized protein n=1 Tax=Caerostris extrusa TaxID=172846 RepID=A0AAV4NXT0_CAEEX|nr:hypothetical protein CEXT_202011 [Caerostris extrusa]
MSPISFILREKHAKMAGFKIKLLFRGRIPPSFLKDRKVERNCMWSSFCEEKRATLKFFFAFLYPLRLILSKSSALREIVSPPHLRLRFVALTK